MRNYMKRTVRIVLITCTIFFTAFETLAQGLNPQTEQRLQQILDSFQNNPANPYIGGMSVALKIDDLANWEGSTGYAARNVDAANNLLPGGTPFATNHLSRIYSVTKTFTSALVLELVNENVLSLDLTVNSILPLNMINPGLNGNVTIRQLLAHESGYSEFLDEMNLQISVAFQPTRTWNAFEVLSFAHQQAAPGGPRKYSSTNYIMLGALVEAVTGIPIEQHFRNRFFTPLQLNTMYLAGRETGGPGLLVSPHDNMSALNPVFQLTGQPTFPDAYTNIQQFPFRAIETISFTTGGIVSDASDLAEFGSALFGGRATSEATRNSMVQSIATVPDEDGDFLGFGIWRSTKISSTDVFIGHDGNATGYRSIMFYQPDKKLTLVILSNYRGADLYDVAKVLYEALPDFNCGNGNGNADRILVCKNGKTHCIARPAASNMIQNGATLGSCETSAASRGIENENKLLTPAEGFIIKAYPNPASGKEVIISFKSAAGGKAGIEVYNSSGQLISRPFSGYTEKGQIRQVHLSTAELPGGLYYIRLNDGAGVQQQKLLVNN